MLPKSRTRILELDGLRGIAILLVLLYHFLSWPTHSAIPILRALAVSLCVGWVGVDLFFVLSGFLIGGILLDSKDNPDYFGRFYRRRVRRIFPVYFAMVLLAPVVTAITHEWRMPWWAYTFFVENFWVAAHRGGWGNYLDVAWSLAVEEQFYLFLPLLIWLVPRKYIWQPIAAIAICTPFVRLYVAHHLGGNAAYTLPFCRTDSLMCGVLLALLVRSKAGDFLKTRPRWVLLGGALPVIGLLVAQGVRGSDAAARSTFGFTPVALFFAWLLLLVVTNCQSAFAGVCRWAWLRWLGGISYGLYLVHQPVQQLVYTLAGYSLCRIVYWNDLIPAFIGLATSLLLAQLSWSFFESRILYLGGTHGTAKSSSLISDCNGDHARLA